MRQFDLRSIQPVMILDGPDVGTSASTPVPACEDGRRGAALSGSVQAG